jgi:hypothetical protein
MDSVLLEKAAYWVNFAYIATICLTLIASVVAVFISHQRASLRDAELKKVQAESARDVANANERSATANERAASANAVAAQAQSQAAAATLTQEQLRKQNLELSIQLEQEKRMRLEVEERLAQQSPKGVAKNGQPRVLTEAQEQLLTSTMRRFNNEHVSLVEISDAEAAPLARQINTALSNAEWSIAVSRFGALAPPQYGIICTHAPSDRAAVALVETLRSFKLTVYERNSNGNGSARLEILVGLNPTA